MAFGGDVWQWHQDCGTWINDDMMPEPRAMNVAIFLDEVNQFNGPIMFFLGSQKRRVLKAGHDLTTTSYPVRLTINWSVSLAKELVEEKAESSVLRDQGVQWFFFMVSWSTVLRVIFPLGIVSAYIWVLLQWVITYDVSRVQSTFLIEISPRWLSAFRSSGGTTLGEWYAQFCLGDLFRKDSGLNLTSFY